MTNHKHMPHITSNLAPLKNIGCPTSMGVPPSALTMPRRKAALLAKRAKESSKSRQTSPPWKRAGGFGKAQKVKALG